MLDMKLLVFDVDGTLADHTAPSKAVIDAINARLSQGDAMAIASGRPYSGIKPYLDYFASGKKYSLGANGVIVQEENGTVLFNRGMEHEVFSSFLARHEKEIGHGLELYCYTEGGLGYLRYSDAIDYEIECNALAVRDLTKEPFKEGERILKFMLAGDSKQIDSFPLTEEDHGFQILRSDPHFLEFVRNDADKASGVESLRKYLGIAPEDVYCFGDQGNDVGMIEAYQGVAMGNATEECKAVAKFVTKPLWEDGVAYALEHFVPR